jgi:Undecaprenyl-phosphate glucose phosphotransferase
MNAHVPLPETQLAHALSSSTVQPGQRVSQPRIIAAVLVSDLVCLSVGGWIAGRVSGFAENVSLFHSILAVFCVSAVVIAALQWRYAYTIPALRNAVRQIAESGLWLFLALAMLIVGAFILGKDAAPMRGWIALWFSCSWCAMAITRVACGILIARWKREGRLVRRAVVAGGGKTAAELIASLDRTATDTISILGLFDDRGADRSPEVVGPYRKLGQFEDLVAFCREESVDLIIIALPPTAEERVLQLLKKLWVLPIDIRISAHASKLKLRARAYNYIGDVPFLPLFDRPMSDWSIAVKAIEDRVIAALALLLLSPLLAVVAIAIKWDSRGPVFFRQQRYGFNNEPIGVFKFRSMYHDQSDMKAAKLVTKDDPRVTRVGRFIRKTSIDELPQLINVLRGELSLVGPRPHAMQAKADGVTYDDAVEGYFARHRVKPGITGWAQINGWRGETDTLDKIEQRVQHDLHYIDNWSLWFDLYILVKTPLSLLDTKNAY